LQESGGRPKKKDMTVASKNSVVVGYVGYFVGLSLVGLMIYSWSKPRVEGAHAKTAAHGEAHASDVVVEYQAVDGTPTGQDPAEATPRPAPETATAPQGGAAPAATAPAAGGDEWN
jgi:hypothetical protein